MVIGLVVVQLIVIVLIGINVYENRYTASIALIPRESLSFPEDSDLQHFYELNPDYQGQVFIPTWLSYTPEITINADTLNERFNYTTEKPEGTFRVIALGDSWTYGMFMNTENNYSEVLEDLLNNELDCDTIMKFEVVNLGVPSYDIRYAVERFRMRGMKYSPDLVLWHLIENDFQEINEFLKPRTKRLAEQASAEGGDSDGRRGSWREFTKPPDELEFGIWQRAVRDQFKEYGEEGVAQYQEEALSLINEYYQGPLVVFSLIHESKIEDKYRPIIGRFVASRANTYFYESELRLRPDGVLPDWHPNTKGHKMIAYELLRYVTQKNLMPCDPGFETIKLLITK